MKVNLNESFFTHTRKKSVSPKLLINRVEIKQVKEFNFLGVVINVHLHWKNHGVHLMQNIKTKWYIKQIETLPALPNYACTSQLLDLISY